MRIVGRMVRLGQSGGSCELPQRPLDLAKESDDRSYLVFDVIDTGIGIPKEKWGAIFDPFVQGDSSVTRKFGGTGLGLAICRRIVEAMGGTLTLSSEVGQGSVFTATIDVTSSPSVPAAGASRSDIVPAAPRPRVPANAEKLKPEKLKAANISEFQFSAFQRLPRVLVVEDGDTNRKLIDLILRRAGLEVATAENGKLGVDAAMSGPFDLILMDMQMPVMDGYTAARLLRQNGLTLPIIALTAHAMSGDEEKCRAAGCSGFVTKPIHAESLLQTVSESIAQGSRAQGARSREQAEVRDQRSEVRGQRSEVRDQRSDLRPPTSDLLTSTLPTEDPDFREIVEEFVDRLHAQIGAMQRALGRGDLDELARLAHWLKGAGGSAGFPALTAPAKHLETLVRDDQCEEIENAISELLEITARIVKPSESEVRLPARAGDRAEVT